MNLQNFPVFGKDKYTQNRASVDLQAEVQNAINKLTPISYAERYRPVKNFIVAVRSTYPALSVLLAAVVAFMAAQLFIPQMSPAIRWPLVVAFTLFGFAVAAGVEKLKMAALVQTFQQVANYQNANFAAVAVLMCFSIALSAAGGYLVSYQVADKSVQIAQTQQHQADSIKSIYAGDIAAQNAAIKSTTATIEKYSAGNWRVGLAQDDLQVAQEAKAGLLKQQKQDIAALATTTTTAQSSNENQAVKLAGLAVLIVLIFELFYLWGYRYEFMYYRNVAAENVQMLPDDLQRHHHRPTMAMTAPAPELLTPSPVGFQQFSNKTAPVHAKNGKTAPAAPNFEAGKGFLVTCPTCGKNAYKKRENAKFCSTDCRKKHHKK